MSRFPTGVVVVSVRYRGRPHGFAVNSFTSISLDPMLVMFCVSCDSGTLPYLRAEGHFAVSVLAADQAETCKVFARKGADRFAGQTWSLSRSGQPLLDDAVAWFDCVINQIVPGGDHEIIIGEVLDVAECANNCRPLVFHQGEFTTLG